jgi:hypothetical protein
VFAFKKNGACGEVKAHNYRVSQRYVAICQEGQFYKNTCRGSPQVKAYIADSETVENYHIAQRLVASRQQLDKRKKEDADSAGEQQVWHGRIIEGKSKMAQV